MIKETTLGSRVLSQDDNERSKKLLKIRQIFTFEQDFLVN